MSDAVCDLGLGSNLESLPQTQDASERLRPASRNSAQVYEPLFLRSSALASLAALTSGAKVASGSAV